jgi:hypothetical protein
LRQNKGIKMKIERGVMAMKDGLAWGVVRQEGNYCQEGWVAPENAPLHNPEFCKKPTHLTYPGSQYVQELATATLVRVERRTEVITLASLDP